MRRCGNKEEQHGKKKMTYPVSFRKKILKIKDKEGLSFAELTEKFNIFKAAIFRWSKKIEPERQKWSKIDARDLKNDIDNTLIVIVMKGQSALV